MKDETMKDESPGLCQIKCPNCSRWGIALDDDGESKCTGCGDIHMQAGLPRYYDLPPQYPRETTLRSHYNCRCYVEPIA